MRTKFRNVTQPTPKLCIFDTTVFYLITIGIIIIIIIVVINVIRELLQMMLDPSLSAVIITQQQHQPYSYISLAQIDRQMTSDNPGIPPSN